MTTQTGVPHMSFPALNLPIVAILRGIRPDEAEAVTHELLDAGLQAIEVPLNSPDAFRSIEIAAKLAPEGVLIGAGTVTRAEEVASLHDAGGRLLVSPNIDDAVMEAARGLGMVTMPGVLTPTEALRALRLGASALKFFPASVLGPSGISAIRTILPPDATIAAVGGVGEENFASYLAAGVSAFGIGSNLFRPGLSASEVGARARSIVAAYTAAARSVQKG
ncbi:2-dehydro-3-deoxy-6-phosphogalactonate aldolase [Paracoccus denitrificans]|jgi:2-dehydro-3-deoxyphosphogalactonate aldolase|uniref:2-keto-3-deoxy-phosphogalactonate aldolase n=1 Tax=Paracoccus denitrificans (strain Pd 1222) TaxID=318586 RepID=A1BBU6_PARDP|nr:2-dehydro-3-deoxy-6-phosphogalactonate aldolase [Paracoccus denitrificans]ABL72990.1 2-keto-3-deoxy-phosphogalactonate aldolase [Paracoccus denitrificans PD1222]MBB4628367.1 2-dehydro-3-deoxyphosphogalactonate aldolase [Paracoccus denitrificans]MCU7429579.1 2-dehydro-3-deoxy-6-phosphogalactonate aldolase [Paracoccus denitrificans]SDI99884.1 2-keto-3-deoxy-phosphogalactonate aldolase [Paracoccus denitrificans]SFR12367.1 2-keto-3-deoxy-phosphogalactonate aldolase [Paracoccus denitrificans]